MDFKTFAAEHPLEYSKNRIEKDQVQKFVEIISVPFGRELIEYVTNYGYLAYGTIELYGINSLQMCDSDMIKQTLYLHQYFPKTENFIALENQGDGDYFLIDAQDRIFEYDSVCDHLVDTGLSFFQYVVKRFQEIDA